MTFQGQAWSIYLRAIGIEFRLIACEPYGVTLPLQIGNKYQVNGYTWLCEFKFPLSMLSGYLKPTQGSILTVLLTRVLLLLIESLPRTSNDQLLQPVPC
jgi:hypothetical protein